MRNDQKMTFKALENTNQKLNQNPELSEHNKKVIDDFFRKAKAGGVKEVTLKDYASRLNNISSHIDFKLDQPKKKDLENIVSKFNQDIIRKENGEKYSDYSKDKFWKTISRFYKSFIKKQGKGYNQEVDGPELIEDLEIRVDLSTEVDPAELPQPSEVKMVVKHANSLRDKTIILIGWSTGARIGELVKTQYDDNVLTWKDITFQEDKAWITLDGKTGEREIPIKTGFPVLKQLFEENKPDQEEPVFQKKNKVYYCPRCGTKTNSDLETTYENRVYSCKNSDCDWSGGNKQVEKKVEPLTATAVRRILERTVKRSGMDGQFKDNPHGFFRKSRAMYKVRIGYTEHQLRGFFGWSETSDAPKHYIQCVKEDLEKALAEEFGEEVEYDNGYDEEALRPVECVQCGKVNSPVQDLCSDCGNPLTDQGEKISQTDKSKVLTDSLSEIAEERDIPEEEFSDMLEEKSVIELMKTLG